MRLGLYNPQKELQMAYHKKDPLAGLAADQSGPLDKIQNGDPNSSPNRDQRSGCSESGGPKGTLQKELTLGSNRGSVIPPQETEAVYKGATGPNFPEGVSGEPAPSDAHDRAGTGDLVGEGFENLKAATDGDQGAKKVALTEEEKKGE
jgi:hypothetical protein